VRRGGGEEEERRVGGGEGRKRRRGDEGRRREVVVPVCMLTKVFQALKALLSQSPDARQHRMMGMSV